MTTDDPRPPRIFSAEYYARMRVLEADSWWNAAMRDIAGSLLRDARLSERGMLVDVGCGSGQTISWFQGEWPDWSAAGLDVAREGLAAALDLGHHVVQGSAMALPHADASTDLIITFDVLQHLPLDGGDAQALSEMRRALKPGGVLLVRTNAQAFPRAAADRQYNFRKYTPDLLRDRLESAGFRVETLGRVNALLGLAEIPREMRARRSQSSEYHGILSGPRSTHSLVGRLKRRWLAFEGRALRDGWHLPLGRTIFALCRRPA
ncbi:MAG: class I SAM-dependent methyltransferase [Gemmatimonadaceae bacterium]|nr:class I SAM-dependent methyltransferase [Gemmatimonadaceae bacterium]